MKRLTVRIEDEIEQRLERLASQTNHTKSNIVREAILSALHDLEDVYLADQVQERIRKEKEISSTLDEPWRPLNNAVSAFKK